MRALNCYVIFNGDHIYDFILEQEIKYRVEELKNSGLEFELLVEDVYKRLHYKNYCLNLIKKDPKKFIIVKLVSLLELEVINIKQGENTIETEFFTLVFKEERILLYFNIYTTKDIIVKTSFFLKESFGSVFEISYGGLYHVSNEKMSIGKRAEESFNRESLLTTNNN